MAVMTAQPPLALVAEIGAVPVGEAAALVEDADGGRVFVHGCLVHAWDAGQDGVRRLAVVQLAATKAAAAGDVADAFGVDAATLWRWQKKLAAQGLGGLVEDKRGPKGPWRVGPEMTAEILGRRGRGESLRKIAAAVGVVESTVRRVLAEQGGSGDPVRAAGAGAGDGSWADGGAGAGREPEVLPVLPGPAVRSAERAAARAGLIEHASPVFAPAGRVPLAGLFLALPALEATGLLRCAGAVYGALPDGFYGLEATLLEAVLRTLAGEPRAEGASRIDPVALGWVLGLDRAPEVKTIRRRLGQLAAAGRAAELGQAMAAGALARGACEGLAAVLYVDGHVRAYQGTRKIGKAHSTRLKFPAPATVETWVSDAHGDPVLVVMAEPGASLAMELRRLLPTLRAAVGDDRRVLVGFDRGGWSPALFRHMAAHGFDVLTWRKGHAPDIDGHLFAPVEHIDEAGRTHRWEAAETITELPVGKKEDGEVFAMRQISRRTTTGKDGRGGVRQIHLLTTVHSLSAGELLYRMGSRWRQENHFRYARMHFDLDAHDSYTATLDDPDRMVPNPAKKTAHQQVLAAHARLQSATAAADKALLGARTPEPGQTSITVTNQTHNAITAPMIAAEQAYEHAKAVHRGIPARVKLGQIAPGQLVLDTETKQITHAIRIAAFNTATALARDIRVNTGFARAHDEAHALIRQALTGGGDIDPTPDGTLTIRLDPLPTKRATKAISELCEHLTSTETLYPGTNLKLRYEVKTALPALHE